MSAQKKATSARRVDTDENEIQYDKVLLARKFLSIAHDIMEVADPFSGDFDEGRFLRHRRRHHREATWHFYTGLVKAANQLLDKEIQGRGPDERKRERQVRGQ